MSSRDRLARIVIFDQLRLDFPELGGYLQSGDFKLTPDGLGLQLNAQSVTF